jgi:hypothetical protein
MRDRLADPTLADRAVEIRLGSDDSAETCLAVPLGGQRVAGEVTVEGWTQALKVLLALDGQPGFPDLRDSTHCSSITALRTIRWGLNPAMEDPARALMWGYHKAGVRSYEDEQSRADARIPVTPMPEPSTGPAVARIYDVLLGRGWDSYGAERRFVRSLSPADAEALSKAALINRMHLPNVVGHLASRGIDQFLDLGSGLLPDSGGRRDDSTNWALHAVVARHLDTARVIYADHDKSLLGTFHMGADAHPIGPQWVQGDILYMEQFLNSARVQYLLDWSRPIGVFLHDVLPWIGSDEAVTAAMDVLRERLPSGSSLSITHATDFDANRMTRFTKKFRKVGIDFKPRDAAAIKALFGDWPLEAPWLVPPHGWRASHPQAALEPHTAGAVAGLAFKPKQPPLRK